MILFNSSGRIVSLDSLFIILGLVLNSCAGQTQSLAKQESFEKALTSYETQAAALISSKDPQERASVIMALAAIGSPKYAEARDALLNDTSADVQIALLDAIRQTGDSSQTAKSILEKSFASAETGIIMKAIQVGRHYPHPLDFRNIWSRNKTNYFWGDYIRTNGWSNWALFGGIGETRPWIDPSWNDLSFNVQMNMLFRAGTRESVALGIKLAKTQDPPKWQSMQSAEPVDIAFIRELLNSEYKEVKQYAARTLLDANDHSFISTIHNVLREYHKGIANIPDDTLDDLCVWKALPLLDENELKGLLYDNPAKWFQPVYGELKMRGKPLTYANLRGYGTPYPLFDISRVSSDLLHSCQLKALVDENKYEELPKFIDLAFMDPNTAAAMSGLQVIRTSRFRKGMPPDIANTCKSKIQEWLGKGPENGGPPKSNPNGEPEAEKLVLFLSNTEELSIAWQKFRVSEEPFKDKTTLCLILQGIDEKSAALRNCLADCKSSQWFSKRIGYPAMEYLKNTTPENPPQDPCSYKRYLNLITIPLPDALPKFRKFKEDLSASISESGVKTEEDFIVSFLKIRGVPINQSDPTTLLDALMEPSYLVRSQVEMLLRKKINMAGFPTLDVVSLTESKKWVESNRFHLVKAMAEQEEPATVLSAKDKTWLENQLLKERKKYFDSLIEDLVNSRSSGICESKVAGFESAHPDIWEPSDIFISQAGLEFRKEIHALLSHEKAIVRHSAALALWKMLRDPESLDVFKKDAEAVDVSLQASSLNTIQKLRCREMASFYPPLLKSDKAILRQVGLVGVQVFDLKDAMPDVISLVADPNSTTSSLAIDVMGKMHPPEARPLLMKLLLENYPQAERSTVALTHYRTNDDIDYFLSSALKEGTSSTDQQRFIGIISRITGRPGLQRFDPYMRSWSAKEEINKETLQDWKEWWEVHRKDSPDKRFMSILAELVNSALNGSDEKMIHYAQWQLGQWKLIPNSYCFDRTGPVTPQCRETVSKWWNRTSGKKAWDVLADSGSESEYLLEICLEIDPDLTKKAIFSSFYQHAVGNNSAGYFRLGRGDNYKTIVELSGVDFGNPSLAKCETKEKVIADWLMWAKSAGWAE